MWKTPLTALALIAVVGCASAPVYGPAQSASGYGYRDQQVEADRYRVSYRGRNVAAADDGALRRAAELTLAQKASWFRVVARDVETSRGRYSGPSIGIGGSTGGRNSSVGIGVRLPLGGEDTGDATVRLEILLGWGEAPAGEVSVYDARSVLGNLGGLTVGKSGLDTDG